MHANSGYRPGVSLLGVLLAIATTMAMALPALGAGSLIISEFRLRGPNGAQDEFIEIYNDSASAHTVVAASGTGYGIAASDGVVRCSINNGTIIPARGHWLCTNSASYSLAAYPAGDGETAVGDASYTTDIPDDTGIALFNNNTGGASFSVANRFDAVGSTAEANLTYKEGTGLPTVAGFSVNFSFVRDECGKGGALNLLGPCTISTPKDTDDNAVDFYFVDTNATNAGAGQRLGAPGPQNLSSPVTPGLIANAPLDSTVGLYTSPNNVRTLSSDINAMFGKIAIRVRFTNNTGAPVTRLRLRITDQDTFPSAPGFADLRAMSSVAVVVAGINDAATCAAIGAPVTPPCTATVSGTTLEQPLSSPNGGAFNASLSAGTVTLATPLANGASIALQFLFGVQQTGAYRLNLLLEGSPAGGGAASVYRQCGSDGCAPTVTSIVRASPNPTTGPSADFTVTFSESVTGVDAGDFVLATTGTAGGTISGVTGSGATRTVTVGGISGEGTLRLDLVDDDTIANVALTTLGGSGTGNGSFSAGEAYTVGTSPTVASIARVGPTPTSASSIQFTVTFSESVTGVDATDFALTSTGSVAPSVTGVTGTGSTRTVTVSTGGAPGTIRLNLIDDDSIVDATANPLGGVGVGNGSFSTGEVFEIALGPGPAAAIPTIGSLGLALLGCFLAGAAVLVMRRLL